MIFIGINVLRTSMQRQLQARGAVSRLGWIHIQISMVCKRKEVSQLALRIPAQRDRTFRRT